MSLQPEYRRPLALILGIASLYLLLWLFLPKPAFWGIDNGYKFQGARAFAQTGSVIVPYPGAELDHRGAFRTMISPFGRFKERGQAPVFSVFFMMTTGLLYRLFGDIGPFLLPLLAGWGTLFAGWLLWERARPSREPLLYLVLLGLGTPLLFYSLALWEHSAAMAFMTLAFAFIAPPIEEHDYRWGTVWAGLLMAAAAAMRTEAVIPALLLIIFWAYTERSRGDWLRYIAGLFAGLALFAVINDWQTTTPVPLHIISNLHSKNVPGFQETFGDRLANIYVLLVEGFPSPLWSILFIIPLVAGAMGRWWRRSPFWWYLFAGAVLFGWAIYLASAFDAPDRVAYTLHTGGLLWVAPLLVLALIPFANRLKGFWGLVWIVCWLSIALIAFGSPTVRGVHWGPRFIVVFAPLLLLFATVRLQRWWSRYVFTRPLLLLLLAISVLNQFFSFDLLSEAVRRNDKVWRWVAEGEKIPILTTAWWLPGDCAVLSDRSIWFLTDSRGRLNGAVGALRRSDATAFRMVEYPPYLDKKTWTELGVAVAREDYLNIGAKRLRRTLLQFVSAPVDSLITSLPEHSRNPAPAPD